MSAHNASSAATAMPSEPTPLSTLIEQLITEALELRIAQALASIYLSGRDDAERGVDRSIVTEWCAPSNLERAMNATTWEDLFADERQSFLLLARKVLRGEP